MGFGWLRVRLVKVQIEALVAQLHYCSKTPHLKEADLTEHGRRPASVLIQQGGETQTRKERELG